MMNSVHFMLAGREVELMKKIEKLTPLTRIEDHMLLHAAESELSEIKMAQEILNDYEAEHFPQVEPSDFPFSCCHQKSTGLPEMSIFVGKPNIRTNPNHSEPNISTNYRK